MATLRESFHIKGNDFIHAGEGAIKVKNLLKALDIDPNLTRRIAICGYEAEMNVVMHGTGGTLLFEINSDRVVLETVDVGVGIEDIESAMREGFSTARDEHREMGFGAGMRLNLGFFLLRYDLAWATDFDQVSAHPSSYFSFGADF